MPRADQWGHGARPEAQTLLVAQLDPWGETNGARLRLRLAAEALSQFGQVDLLIMSRESHLAGDTVPSYVARRKLVNPSRYAPTIGRRLAWFAQKRSPWGLFFTDWNPCMADITAWIREQYKVVWVSRTSTAAALHSIPFTCPVIVDVDDLEGEKSLEYSGMLLRELARQPFSRSLLVRLWRWAKVRHDSTCWKNVELEVASGAALSLFCSSRDASRMGARNTGVLPNGYPAVRIKRPGSAKTRPILVFIGTLNYWPNLDGAQTFLKYVFPKLIAHFPSVQLRLIGAAPPAAHALHNPPQVIVTGFVRDVSAELNNADLAVVPLRLGGGTRIKIIEAWAHRLPVVTTSKGAEGLEFTPGKDLLIADEWTKFAAECKRVLEDTSVRHSLADGGHSRFTKLYERSHVLGTAREFIARVIQE